MAATKSTAKKSTAPGRAPAIATPAPAETSATIGAGESFDDTARRLGVDRDALFAANRGVLGSNTDRARAGTPLVIPD